VSVPFLEAVMTYSRPRASALTAAVLVTLALTACGNGSAGETQVSQEGIARGLSNCLETRGQPHAYCEAEARQVVAYSVGLAIGATAYGVGPSTDKKVSAQLAREVYDSRSPEQPIADYMTGEGHIRAFMQGLG
jgi:hypothetical protein